ncbi:MAG: ATP phosphoribosyltransferase [Nitrospinota bacterium]|nr:ATP phosphoribosyltransferase [Nitrospinota bacterium]
MNLTVAIPKGRNLKPTIEIFKRVGIDLSASLADDRKLIFKDEKTGVSGIIVRDTDIPVYVENGAADIGISGKDQLEEQERNIYELLDLGYGKCRLVLAEPKELKEKDDPSRWTNIRIATKFTNLTSKYFLERGIHVEIIKLYGSIEIAPLVGLSERVIDLVSTGSTLKANGLVEVETIMDVSARLIVNRASLKTKHELISGLTKKIEDSLKKNPIED